MPKYIGLRYSQAEGASLVSFVAPAGQIRSWGGIPHKTTDFLGGFQRPLADRYKRIIDYFDEQSNQSPTAIVVAFRPGAVHIEQLPNPSGVEDRNVELVTVDVPDQSELDNASAWELAQKVLDDLKSRPTGPTNNLEPDDDEAEDDTKLSEDIIAEELSENGEQDWGVDVGKSALIEFANKISTPAAVDELIGQLAEQMVEAGKHKSVAEATPEATDELREALQSLLRPAMIVDGQHRVYGAAECEREIPFTVVAIEDADWKEQVFQFVIINRQARAISGEFLASIVNSSLTNYEIGQLEERLESAGLSTYETRMLRLMNDDPDSPFKGMISKGVDESGVDKITFKAAMAIVRRWSHHLPKRDPAYKVLFQPRLPGSNAKEKRDEWSRIWKDFMFAFWHGVRNLYKDEQLWQPKTQLMYRATLEVLQDNFLEKKAAAGGVTYGDPVNLRQDVEEFYQGVPAGFFHTEWKRKELLTKDGRSVLKNALNKMRVPNTKFKSLTNKDPLFTGASK